MHRGSPVRRAAPLGSTTDRPLRLISSIFSKFKSAWLRAALVAGSASLAYPAPALASIFSVFAATAAAEESPTSSSNPWDALLVAPDQVEATRAAREISIVGGSALLAESPADGDIVEAERPKNESISIYEVRAGDTLAQVAEMYGVSANTIRWANDLKGAIAPGQRLVILPITGVSYTVKKGDTVAGIAKKFGADAGDIARYNDIDDASLFAGATIIVPDGEVAAAPVAKKPASTGVRVGGSLASTASASGFAFTRPTNGVKTQGIHGHNGIDIGAPVGTPVVAAAGGTVIVAKADAAWNGGYGSYVVIDHGSGVQTLYAHLSSVAVSVGQSVSRGDLVGAVGNTGKSTGNHLHFEVRGAANPF